MVKNVSDKNTQNSARIVHVTDVQNILRQICSDEVKAPTGEWRNCFWSTLVFSADLSSLSGEQKGSVHGLSWELLFRLQTSEHIQDDLVAENVLFLERNNRKCYTQNDSRSKLHLKASFIMKRYLCLHHALPLESHGTDHIWDVKLPRGKVENIWLLHITSIIDLANNVHNNVLLYIFCLSLDYCA